MRRFLSAAVTVLMLALPQSALADMALLMAEEAGCIWCARWDKEIADIYPKTPEGQAAPLTRIDIHDALPPGITLERVLHFTPTFVLLDDGQALLEQRIEELGLLGLGHNHIPTRRAKWGSRDRRAPKLEEVKRSARRWIHRRATGERLSGVASRCQRFLHP